MIDVDAKRTARIAADDVPPGGRDPAVCCPELFAAPLGEDDAIELASLLKVLADPARLRLVSIIATSPDGEVCACDVAAPLGRSQPTVSHHLSQLVKAGILDRTQRGRWAWFRLRDERLTDLARVLAPRAAAEFASDIDRESIKGC